MTHQLSAITKSISAREQKSDEDVKALTLPTKESELLHEIDTLSKRMIGGVEVKVTKILIRAADIESKVQVHKLNMRIQSFLKRRNVDDLIADIEENSGVINEPVLCYFDGASYHAIDGSRRRMAALKGQFDLPLEYFTVDLPYKVIKAHINSTNTSKDFSDFEKIISARNEYRDLLHANAEDESVKSKDLMVDVLESNGFSSSNASISRMKKIFDYMHEEYFEFARVNQISQDSIRKLSEFIAKFSKIDSDAFSKENLIRVFKSVFDELEVEYDGEYSGAEMLSMFRKKMSPQGDNPKAQAMLSSTSTLIENEDFKIELIESAKGWGVKGNGKLSKTFKEEFQQLLNKHYQD
ncbi:hypothetical protein [Photobacterium galatheae]|uniref:ParB/Sulfiredoxin domain-containing protein n=1 Tax=Photobacterium galatheae TaxID=1654360 RepID=A0A066RL37_9GAMM|nr:hypothetical protein [Photobacterium galatheae]KDM91059.1 hypothetical protein EA58_15065 [Photobacterium galatheae]MCM0148990.1 hypothetical protein [Photobacterium galatheae]